MIERPRLKVCILVEVSRVRVFAGSTAALGWGGGLIPAAWAGVWDGEVFAFEAAGHGAPFLQDGAWVAAELGRGGAAEVGGFEEGGGCEVVGFYEDDVGFGGCRMSVDVENCKKGGGLTHGYAETEVFVQAF